MRTCNTDQLPSPWLARSAIDPEKVSCSIPLPEDAPFAVDQTWVSDRPAGGAGVSIVPVVVVVVPQPIIVVGAIADPAHPGVLLLRRHACGRANSGRRYATEDAMPQRVPMFCCGRRNFLGNRRRVLASPQRSGSTVADLRGRGGAFGPPGGDGRTGGGCHQTIPPTYLLTRTSPTSPPTSLRGPSHLPRSSPPVDVRPPSPPEDA